MSKKKYHWYVLVISNNGPVFVTKVNYSNKTAEWNKDEKPLEFSKYSAEDLTMGLNLNFHLAFTVSQPFEIESQPYNYKDWDIKFVEKTKEETENDKEKSEHS